MDIDSTVLRATKHSLTPWGITARPSLPRADGELLCKNLVARGELTLHEEFVELQGFAYLLICPHISYQEVMFHGFSSMFANKFGICHLESAWQAVITWKTFQTSCCQDTFDDIIEVPV